MPSVVFLPLRCCAMPNAAKRRHCWVRQAALLLDPASDVVMEFYRFATCSLPPSRPSPRGKGTNTAKRRRCWVRQAASLLSPPSGVNAGLAKRRKYCPRQAASLLGPPSGVVTGFCRCVIIFLLPPPQPLRRVPTKTLAFCGPRPQVEGLFFVRVSRMDARQAA